MKNLIEIIQEPTCTAAWLKGLDLLLKSTPLYERANLILAIEKPDQLDSADKNICKEVDSHLVRAGKEPLATVAGTIFPGNHYIRNGRKGVFYDFPADFEQMETHSWGIYAMRLLRRNGKEGEINPLEILINKLSRHKSRNRSAYELNVAEENMEIDIPLYDTGADCNRLIPQPCLSHLTFKVVGKSHLSLTALYRSHFYVTKALGNLLGLAQLQYFVASETNLKVGPLICHSTHARVDRGSGVTLDRTRKLAKKCLEIWRAEQR